MRFLSALLIGALVLSAGCGTQTNLASGRGGNGKVVLYGGVIGGGVSTTSQLQVASVGLGGAASTTGTLKFFGTTSGSQTWALPATGGAGTLTWPATAATTANYVLSNNGSGVLSWVAQSGGGGGVTWPLTVPDAANGTISGDSIGNGLVVAAGAAGADLTLTVNAGVAGTDTFYITHNHILEGNNAGNWALGESGVEFSALYSAQVVGKTDASLEIFSPAASAQDLNVTADRNLGLYSTTGLVGISSGAGNGITCRINGDLLLSVGSTLAQAATTGFPFIPKCATGAPSGTPTTYNGAALVVGGDNHVYANPTASAWIQVDGIAGEPDSLPPSPNAFDDEFNGSSLSGSWAATGAAAGLTQTVGEGALVAKLSGAADTPVYCVTKDPGSTFTITSKLTYFETSQANSTGAGLIVRDSVSGKAYWFQVGVENSTPEAYVYRINSNGLTSGSWVSKATLAIGQNLPQNHVYLRVSQDSTNITFYYSPNGQLWIQVLQEGKTAHLTNPANQLGPMVWSGQAMNASWDWIRKS